MALAGGAPAGQLWDRDQPLREDETLLLCLPQDHEEVQRLRRPLQEELARARAVCPGCRLCTDACPQALRGAPLRPDLIASVVDAPSGWAQGCVGCGVCDAICPQGLSPARLLGVLQPPQAGLWGEGHPSGEDEAPRAAKERRLPLSLLTTRLRLGSYAGP